MQIRCFSHTLQHGWSIGLPSELDGAHTLLLVFGAPEYRQQPDALAELSAAFPQSLKVGCSTAGEIFGPTIQDHSLSVAVVKFDHTKIRVASSPITADASFDAGKSMAMDLDDEMLKSLFVLSDGLGANGSELVRGMETQLHAGVKISGGLSGDGDRFRQTWTWDGHDLQTGVVHGIGFYGDALECAHGSYGGWYPFGPERLVTRASANVLYEVDGQPALELYKRYLGEYAKDLPSSGLLFPLAIRAEYGEGEQIVRTILAVDEEQQSMTFAGNIPEGSYAQLMSANFEQLIDGASKAAHQMVFPSGISSDGLLIGVSCVGRRLLLGEQAEDELEAVLDALGKPTNFIGFYSYGEISPNASHVGCSLRNQTMTLTYIHESDASGTC